MFGVFLDLGIGQNRFQKYIRERCAKFLLLLSKRQILHLAIHSLNGGLIDRREGGGDGSHDRPERRQKIIDVPKPTKRSR